MVTQEIKRFPEPIIDLDDIGEGSVLEVIRQLTIPLSIKELALNLEREVPNKLLLGFLRDGRLKVIAPITVKVTSENEDIIVEAEDFNEFGFGNNLSEALADLQRAIVELYFTLEKEQERLGTDMQHVWDALRAKIIKRI